MNTTQEKILDYYLQNLDTLGFANKFHFISRMYLWTGDQDFRKIINTYQGNYIGKNKDESKDIINNILRKELQEIKNAKELREPFFNKYSNLKRYNAILFKFLFAREIFDINIKNEILEIISEDDFINLGKKLYNDQEAISILSTHAINYFYHITNLLDKDLGFTNVNSYIDIFSSNYDLNNIKHVQLMIYLLTHCIIGESKFYTSRVTNNTSGYFKAITLLEELIEKKYFEVNLDNKMEFLVSCKLLNYVTKLEKIIYSEADHSISNEGLFLVDKYNMNKQGNTISLDKSEHRNVLFIMSGSDFSQNQIENSISI